MLSEFLVGRLKHDDPLVVLEHNEWLSKSKQSNAPNLLSGWRNNAAVCYNRSFESMQKLEQYYYGDASYFLNKDQIIDIPSDDEILPGDSEDEDIFDKPSLTLISKNNSKGNNKGKEKIVICKEKAVKVSTIDALLNSLDIDEKM